MRRTVQDGYELDDDPRRVDIDAVNGFLSEHAYWAKGRRRDRQVERGPLASLRWMLHTQDAHGLYERFGFASPRRPVLERPARTEGR